MRLVAALVVSLSLAVPARAGSADDEERARGHYEIGLGLYRLGDYHGALKEFAAGYELAHRPGFLLNLGQTYRKLGELREARDMYRQFLAEAPHDDPARPEARKVL
ncbi:MAG TPA: tetratricopeptide repeat protein, partial [Polyangia bacterium]